MSKFGKHLKILEVDGNPSIVPTHVFRFPNGTLTNPASNEINFTGNSIIGVSVIGGTSNCVLYINASGNLACSTNFQYNANTLTIINNANSNCLQLQCRSDGGFSTYGALRWTNPAGTLSLGILGGDNSATPTYGTFGLFGNRSTSTRLAEWNFLDRAVVTADKRVMTLTGDYLNSTYCFGIVTGGQYRFWVQGDGKCGVNLQTTSAPLGTLHIKGVASSFFPTLLLQPGSGQNPRLNFMTADLVVNRGQTYGSEPSLNMMWGEAIDTGGVYFRGDAGHFVFGGNTGDEYARTSFINNNSDSGTLCFAMVAKVDSSWSRALSGAEMSGIGFMESPCSDRVRLFIGNSSTAGSQSSAIHFYAEDHTGYGTWESLWELGTDYFQDATSSFYLWDSSSGELRFIINDSGYVGLSITSPTERLQINGNFHLLSDSQTILLGGGKDMSLDYDGTQGNIKTNLVAASDLHIDCGTDKTIVLDETVWEDVQFPISDGRIAAANYPNWEAFTTNTNEFAFDVNEYIDLASNEVPHGWKEGTTGSVHLHLAIKSAQSTGANRYAKFTVYIAYADVNEVWTEASALSAEYTIPTGTAALTHYLLPMGNLSLPNNLIGTQIKLRVKRIAATGGTEYADSVFITQAGIHFENDQLGSRTVTAK